MKRHVLDQPKTHATSGMKLTFSRIPLKNMPRKETLMLQRRPRQITENLRMREYARIDRGYTA